MVECRAASRAAAGRAHVLLCYAVLWYATLLCYAVHDGRDAEGASRRLPCYAMLAKLCCSSLFPFRSVIRIFFTSHFLYLLQLRESP